MYYFINTSFNQKKSGIEHAQMKRLALFKNHGAAAQIVTRFFSLTLHKTLQDAGLVDTDMVNLFDFFQDSLTFKKRSFKLADLALNANLQVIPNDDGHSYLVKDGARLVQRIRLRAPEYTDVETIWTFDRYNKLVKSQWWDWRGFMALEQWYDVDGQVTVELVFAPSGKQIYQTFHTKDQHGKLVNSLYRINDWHGHEYSFTGEQALMRFFLDELNKANRQKNVFVADRAFELSWSLLNMKTRAFKLLHLHANHLNNPNNPVTANLNYNYEYAIKNRHSWQGIIVPTQQQREDLITRWGDQVPIYTLPVGVVSRQTLAAPPVPWNTRHVGQIIMVARLSPEKQQEKVIAAFEQIHQRAPQARLAFWGYANGQEGTRLKKLVTKKKLRNLVTFHDYTRDIAAVYNQAQILVLASRSEGFSLAILEAQSHGLPCVSFAAKYGPQDLISDGVDGYLVPVNDISALANTVVRLLNDDDKMQQFSHNAYLAAKRFSEDTVWTKWQVVFQAVQRFYKEA
ncbi:glycosyltransferase [Loigolactobacillus backii]|uniref:glycosyltransferase n=2 Tax=Loigolactobacillus backii TaxID=375175 RepID=UPI0022FD3D60|nr:glycosyltransferase [Loigolactobacillus backii]MDA5387835.1 glycosyltransferase [Loigolactobacillus backii]MDA5390327.1 glycosyltransferase [Loigolactobacillus backii]